MSESKASAQCLAAHMHPNAMPHLTQSSCVQVRMREATTIVTGYCIAPFGHGHGHGHYRSGYSQGPAPQAHQPIYR